MSRWCHAHAWVCNSSPQKPLTRGMESPPRTNQPLSGFVSNTRPLRRRASQPCRASDVELPGGIPQGTLHHHEPVHGRAAFPRAVDVNSDSVKDDTHIPPLHVQFTSGQRHALEAVHSSNGAKAG
mmetsp:Transcript_4980/g.13512  ORF Transcript_4980/g.13512 Transcript_4980/m.13512 type:complete len:125 (+) Transcript_4980:311-685(+)